MDKIIYPQPPYDMERVLQKCAHEAQFKVNQEKKELSFPVRIKVHPQEERWKSVLCFLTNLGTVEEPKVRLRVVGEALTVAEQNWLDEHVSRRFQWRSEELPRFYTAIQDSPRLTHLVQELRGLPFIQYEGIFEGFVQTIIQQQVHFRFARQLTYSLAHTYGETLTHNGVEYPLLPTASQLAKVNVAELHARKFSRRKAEYIIDLARLIEGGEVDVDKLSTLDNDLFLKEMIRVRGVGVWTVECVLLFCLGRPNVFPAGDIGLQNALQLLEGYERRPSPEECREWVRPYQDWASYIAVYLWGLLGE